MSTSAKREQLPAPASADKTRLVEANVNPQTGFASDYLNHFNEAVMLLELMAEVPECREDFAASGVELFGRRAAHQRPNRHLNLRTLADVCPRE